MSEIGDKIHVGTDVYIAYEDEDWNCRGCSAEDNASLCSEISNRVSCHRIIWIKQQPVQTQVTTCNETKEESEMNTNKSAENTTEEPKYTLAEFLEVCDDWYGNCDGNSNVRDNYFKQFLERKNNPEYQEFLRIEKQYLELKQKFS